MSHAADARSSSSSLSTSVTSPRIGSNKVPDVNGEIPHVAGKIQHVSRESPHVGGEVPHVTSGKILNVSGEITGQAPHVTGEIPHASGEIPHVTGEIPCVTTSSCVGRLSTLPPPTPHHGGPHQSATITRANSLRSTDRRCGAFSNVVKRHSTSSVTTSPSSVSDGGRHQPRNCTCSSDVHRSSLSLFFFFAF